MEEASTSRVTRQSRKRQLTSGQTEELGEPQPFVVLDSYSKRPKAKRRPKFVKPGPDPDYKPSEAAKRVMSNAIVLAKIAETLPAKDIFAIRNTCRAWNWNFVPQLKKKHSPLKLGAIIQDKEDKTSSKNRLPAHVQNRTKYIDVIRSSYPTLLPFTRYSFSEYLITADRQKAIEKDRKLMEILAEAGSSVKSLTHVKYAYIASLRKIIFELTASAGGVEELGLSVLAQVVGDLGQRRTLPALPNLKTFHTGEATGTSLQLVGEVLQSAVGLTKLKLGNHCGGQFAPILTELRDSVPAAQLQKLKTLKVALLDADGLQIILQLIRRKEYPLRLEYFAVRVLDDDPEMDDDNNHRRHNETIGLLNEFLALQAPNLRRLKINVADGQNLDETFRPFETAIRLPRMKHLTTFKLVRSGVWRVGIEYEGEDGSGGFVHTFPNLRRFGYVCSRFTRVGYFSGGNLAEDVNRISHPGVVELRLHKIPTFSLSRFGAAFPGVTRLEIDLEPDGSTDDAAKIWTLWPNLTKFRLHLYNHFPDSFLIGIPRAEEKNLRTDLASLDVINLDGLRSLQRKYKRRPGLTDLLHLRQLDFVVVIGSDPNARVSNLGGYFAFALAPKLQQIVVRTYGGRDKKPAPSQDLDSEECKWFLRRVLGPFAVIDV